MKLMEKMEGRVRRNGEEGGGGLSGHTYAERWTVSVLSARAAA